MKLYTDEIYSTEEVFLNAVRVAAINHVNRDMLKNVSIDMVATLTGRDLAIRLNAVVYAETLKQVDTVVYESWIDMFWEAHPKIAALLKRKVRKTVATYALEAYASKMPDTYGPVQSIRTLRYKRHH